MKVAININGTIVHLFFFDMDQAICWFLKNKKSFAIFKVNIRV